MVTDPAVFLLRDTAVQTRHGNTVAGNVLAHEADGCAGGKLITDPGEQAQAFRSEAGQDQVPNQGAFLHDAVLIINRSAGLAAHFLQCGGGNVKVVGCRGAQTASPYREVLQVRKIDINDAFQAAQGIHGFISGSVPDQGKGRTPQLQRLQDAGHKGSACNEGQGVYAQVCQALQRVGKLLRGEETALIPMGNISVLAIDAAQRAARKKDSAGSAAA